MSDEGMFEETDVLQFRDPNQPDLHLVYWTREEVDKKEGARILFWIHGICDHSGRYKTFAKHMLNSVTALDAVMCYDMRGHGRSQGDRGVITGIEQLVEDARAHVLPHMALRYGSGARIVLGGHSLGGCVAAGVASKEDFLVHDGYGKFEGVFLSSPALKVIMKSLADKLMAPFAGIALRIPRVRTLVKPIGIETKDISHNEQVLRDYEADELIHNSMSLGVGGDFLSYGPLIIDRIKSGEESVFTSGIPTMVVHGKNDEITDIAGSRDLVAALQEEKKGHAVLVEIEGARHEVFNELDEYGRNEFYDNISTFLTNAFATA